MKTKFEKFFENLQSKGAFEGIEFKELNEEQNQELYTKYLDHVETEAVKAKEEAEKASGENAELNKKFEELNAEATKTLSELSSLNMKVAKQVTENMLNAANNQGAMSKTMKDMVEECKTFHSALDQAIKNGESVELKLNAKSAMMALKADVLTTSITNPTRGVEDPIVSQIAHRRLTAYDAIPSKPRVPANMGGTYRYLEQDSTNSVRAAAQVAEGAASPESTLLWVKQSLDLKKTSDHLPYSDEFEYDFRDLMGDLVSFLRQNVAIEVDDQIINGNGVGENYDGIFTSVPSYTPVASGITDANIFDLMVIVSEDITDGEGSKYQPDLVFMNSADYDSIDFALKKDANNNYCALEERAMRRGFKVVVNNSVTANTMILGDSRYAHVIEDGMITVKTGLKSGTDAIDGISRVLVETRKNLLIKNEEVTGWRDVASISAALTTLAT